VAHGSSHRARALGPGLARCTADHESAATLGPLGRSADPGEGDAKGFGGENGIASRLCKWSAHEELVEIDSQIG
jgi:hypothetical protein